MSAPRNASSHPFPNAGVLHELLEMLKLKHDPIIPQFAPRDRTSRIVQALRQSERVVESGGDVRQKAFCAFHIGLFNLYWRENVGAAHRFQQAGRYWQITPLPPLVCLASLAEGVAWYRACDKEAALVATLQAERQLERLARRLHGPHPTGKVRRLRAFVERLEGILEQTEAAFQEASDDESGAGVAPPTTNMGDN